VHVPVLVGPALDWLAVRPEGVYVDCTAGAGGHAEQIARRLTTGRLIALDRDPHAVALSRERLARFPQATVLHRNYGELTAVLRELAAGPVDGVLIDAGVSSMQLDDPARGFSFQEEGPLDLRMDATAGPTAAEFLARITEHDLARLLREYGDVGPAQRIASAIVSRQRAGRMRTTADLAEAVQEALAFVTRGMPAEVRTVFQALRIAVNEELRWLETGLMQSIEALAPGGRLVVIAFHSGEDRIVKNVFRAAGRPRRERYPDGRTRSVTEPVLKILTRRPVTPGAAEIAANPRARPAKLRAAERLASGAHTAPAARP